MRASKGDLTMDLEAWMSVLTLNSTVLEWWG